MVDLDKQELFPPQREVMEAGLLEEGKHLLLNMATGSGKTFLAELAIEDVIHSGYKAVYLTPLKALASQHSAIGRIGFLVLLSVFLQEIPFGCRSQNIVIRSLSYLS